MEVPWQEKYMDIIALHKSKHLSVWHFGEFENELKNVILKGIKRKLELYEENLLVRKRIYSIANETIENLIHYGNHSDKSYNYALFSFFKEPILNDYHLTIGNIVLKSQVPSLEQRLNSVCAMTPQEINSEFKKTLMLPWDDATPGAGLGLLLIALKAAKKMEYKFESLDEKNEFFIIKTTIRK